MTVEEQLTEINVSLAELTTVLKGILMYSVFRDLLPRSESNLGATRRSVAWLLDHLDTDPEVVVPEQPETMEDKLNADEMPVPEEIWKIMARHDAVLKGAK